MFFRFPREIRDSIYGYVLESPLTPLDSVQAKFNQSTLLTTGLLKASKQCHEEAMEYMCDEVEVKIYAGLDWEERAKMLLRTCRHITIVWDPLRRTVEDRTWQRELATAFSRRSDIRTFRLQGKGDPILGYMSRNFHLDPFGVYAIIDLLTFERIMTGLSTFPQVKAEKIKVSWVGDDKLKNGEQYVDEFRGVVKAIEEGRGGGGDRNARSSRLTRTFVNIGMLRPLPVVQPWVPVPDLQF